jgi:transcription initiation factor TFIIB
MNMTFPKDLVCPKCKQILRVTKEEVYCPSCGIVFEDSPIDSRPDYKEESEKTGYGSPAKNSDVGIGSVIKDYDLKLLDGKNSYNLGKLMQWNNKLKTAMERNLSFAFNELEKYASQLHIPQQTKEEASRIYREAVQRNLVRGRSMESMAAACLYISCKLFENPRTLDEIAEVANLNKKELGRTSRFVIRQLNISLVPVNPIDYLPKFVNKLNLSQKTQTDAAKLLECAVKTDLTSGRSPQGTAAAALYLTALINKEKRTQRAVAETANVTEVTIRNRYKELLRELNLREKLKKAKL